MKFRKKPVVIEAFQWDGNNSTKGWPKWMDGKNWNFTTDGLGGSGLTIRTLEGLMWAQPSDWIIQGVAGEIYPCKPDIFAQTYESVEEPANAD